MDKKTIIENISKKSKVPVPDLEKEYKEIFNELPPSDDREKKALKELNNRHVGGGEDRTEDFELIVIGLRKLTDFNKKTVDETLEKYNKDKEGLLESGKVKMIDGEPKVIDLQESFEYDGNTIKNPNFGKALEPKYNRDTVVFARRPDEKEWTLSKLAMRDQFATDFEPALMYRTLTANCLGSIEDGLKTGKNTRFNPFDEDINVSSLIANLCGDHVQELGDVYAYTEKLDAKDYDRFVVTSGTVQHMNPPKQEGNSANGAIDDITTDELYTIFVDPILPLPEKKSDYTFVCQPAIKDKKDKDKKPTGEKQLILNVLGYYK